MLRTGRQRRALAERRGGPPQTKTLEVMMIRVFALALFTIPLQAIALEESEFHLYGISKSGMAFDVTPYDHGAGDPDSNAGYTSQFARWVKAGEASPLKPTRTCTASDGYGRCVRWESMHRVGRCTVWLAPSYRVSCATDGQLFSGLTYVGEKLDESRVAKVADANKLYKSFLRRYDGARPDLAAVFRCKEGCTDSLPQALIFLWLGD